jgi:hypothetical protein
MKKILLISVLITLFTLHQPLNCQEYKHFPSNSAKWSVYSRLSPWGEFIEDTFFYFINGDTLIDTTLYQKIYRFTASYFYNDVIDTTQSQYNGGLREDANKHIFFKPIDIYQSFSNNGYIENSTLDEFLLYRFDLELGEEFYLNEYISESYSVMEIDSVIIDSIYRKRFSIEGLYSKWIEGIGSETSLFGSLFDPFEGYEALLCYEDSTTFYYGEWNYFGRCTHFLVGLEEHRNSTVRFFPNPVKNEILIEKDDQTQIGTLALFNQTGQKVLFFKDDIDHFDVSMLPHGVYILSVTTNNKDIIRRKVLIE